MSKGQRVNLIIAEAKDGKLSIDIEFFPKLVPEEKMGSLTIRAQALQICARQIADYVTGGINRAQQQNGGKGEERKTESPQPADGGQTVEALGEKSGEAVNGV